MSRPNRYLTRTVLEPRPAENGGECKCCRNLKAWIHVRLGDLKRSANTTQCVVCYLLYHGAAKYLRSTADDDCDVGVWPRSRENETVILRVYTHTRRPTMDGPADLQTGDMMVSYYLLQSEMRGPLQWPWSQFSSSQLFPTDSSSLATLMQIKSWIQDCEDSHMLCNAPADKTSPMRLIEIQTDCYPPRLRLITDVERVVQYNALSHCWGDHRPMQTTRENLTAHATSILWTALPQCFQDAVTMTVCLGLNYIWIDSICIVQNDYQEWAIESEKLGAIFANAYLVISATRAANSTQGCFASNLGKGSHVLDIACNDQQVPSQILVRRQIRHEQFIHLDKRFNYELREPLLDRAWAFQERLFARRILHFAADELIWECNTQVKCQCSSTRVFDESQCFKLEWATAMERRGAPVHPQPPLLQSWWDLVEMFSGRQLSYATDKLPAISAAARQFSSLGLGRYVAGLWEMDIHRCLLWSVNWFYTKLSRDVYTAPTWSWASVQNPIDRPPVHIGQTLCKMLSVDTIPAAATGDEQTSRASITFQGRVWRTQVQKDTASVNNRGFFIGDKSFIPDIELPLSRYGGGSIPVLCLAIAKSNESDRVWCLVLLGEHPPQYTRIGVIQASSHEFAGAQMEETGTIV